MGLYTEEQIKSANAVSLEQYLRSRGEKLARAGREYKWIYKDSFGEHDSVAVRENRWYDHKNGKGGYTVSFLQEYFGYTFPEAMKELLSGEEPQKYVIHKEASKKPEKEEKKFILPEKSKNMRNLYAYLIKTRFLSEKVVNAFVKQGLIYQEAKYNNIVFVGIDENGKAVSAHKKSPYSNYSKFKATVAGSDTQYGFCYRGSGEKLFVFEAAVDMLSYISLYSENWQENSYLALDGLSPKPMLWFLQTNSKIKEIYICTDYDAAGIENAEKFQDMLVKKGYDEKQIHREYPVYKDWNETLKEKNGVCPILPQPHPKKEEYKKTVRRLCAYNSKKDTPYIRYRQQETEKGGIDFLVGRLNKELRYMQKNFREKNEFQNELKGGAVRIADAAICRLCLLRQEKSEFPTETIYNQFLAELSEAYKPYKDKGKLNQKLEQMKKEIGDARKARDDGQSLFLCLKSAADTAIRMFVYLETDYPREQERLKAMRERQNQEVQREDMQMSM